MPFISNFAPRIQQFKAVHVKSSWEVSSLSFFVSLTVPLIILTLPTFLPNCMAPHGASYFPNDSLPLMWLNQKVTCMPSFSFVPRFGSHQILFFLFHPIFQSLYFLHTKSNCDIWWESFWSSQHPLRISICLILIVFQMQKVNFEQLVKKFFKSLKII